MYFPFSVELKYWEKKNEETKQQDKLNMNIK